MVIHGLFCVCLPAGRVHPTGSQESAGLTALTVSSSGEQILHDMTVHVGQAEVAPLVPIGKFLVIDAH